MTSRISFSDFINDNQGSIRDHLVEEWHNSYKEEQSDRYDDLASKFKQGIESSVDKLQYAEIYAIDDILTLFTTPNVSADTIKQGLEDAARQLAVSYSGSNDRIPDKYIKSANTFVANVNRELVRHITENLDFRGVIPRQLDNDRTGIKLE